MCFGAILTDLGAQESTGFSTFFDVFQFFDFSDDRCTKSSFGKVRRVLRTNGPGSGYPFAIPRCMESCFSWLRFFCWRVFLL